MRLIHKILSFSSLLKWNIFFYLQYWFLPDFRKAINRNKNIRNSHFNERCFIVGNGPSLTNMNLAVLRDEFVFTVNSIYRNDKIYKAIQSNCHVLMDPGFFKKGSEIIDETSECIKKYNPEILLVTEYYKDNKYSKKFKDYHHQIFSHRNNSARIKVDFCKNMAPTQNVVHAAIYTAIYMGFKEIYLIGCDMTSFYENFAANVGKFESFHAYELTEDDKNSYKSVKEIHDNAFMLHDYAITFDIFKGIRRYCEDNNIQVINATDGGILDMFPRANFQNLFM